MTSAPDHPNLNPVYVMFDQIRPILVSAQENGVPVDRFLLNLGLPEGVEKNTPDIQVSLVDYFRLQRDIARSLDDLTANLSERKLTYQTGSFIISQVQDARTLQDSLKGLADYFNMMHGEAYNSVRQNQDSLSLIIDDSTFPYRFRRDGELTHLVGDCLLIKVHCLMDSLSNGLASRALTKVRLQRDRASQTGRQNGFWSVPIQYGHPVYELVYDFETACLPIPKVSQVDLSADGIFARVIKHLERMSSVPNARSFKVRTSELIASGFIQQGDVAKRLGISTATLRRRLSEEEVSFRGMVDQERFEQAEALLIKGQSIAQVSELLNYSDIRSFNRAFKSWKGQTPAAFARTQRDAGLRDN